MAIKSKLISIWNKFDYLDNFKLFDNVYGILDTSYMIYIAFGMTPYLRVKSLKGHFIYHSMGWKKYLISSWYTILLLLALAMTVLKESENYMGNLKSILTICLNTQIIVFALCTVNLFAAASKTLLKAYENCYNAERTLKKLGFKLDYKVIHKVALFGSLSLVFFGVLNVALYLLSDRGVLNLIGYSFVYNFPCAITVIPVYHFFYLGTVAFNRLRTINDYLKEDFSSFTEKQIEFNLFSIANIHSELCNAINNVLQSTSFTIITFYFYTYLQFSVLVLAMLDIAHLNVDVNTYIWNTAYVFTTVGILVVATILKYEAVKTSYTLCELTAAFFDDRIGIRRNTLLFQMLHQKIDLRIYGCFEIHLGRVLSDVQALTNLLIFVTQFRS